MTKTNHHYSSSGSLFRLPSMLARLEHAALGYRSLPDQNKTLPLWNLKSRLFVCSKRLINFQALIDTVKEEGNLDDHGPECRLHDDSDDNDKTKYNDKYNRLGFLQPGLPLVGKIKDIPADPRNPNHHFTFVLDDDNDSTGTTGGGAPTTGSKTAAAAAVTTVTVVKMPNYENCYDDIKWAMKQKQIAEIEQDSDCEDVAEILLKEKGIKYPKPIIYCMAIEDDIMKRAFVDQEDGLRRFGSPPYPNAPRITPFDDLL